MTRTELYADQRMNLQEAQADRIANLEKKTDATIDHIARLEKMLKESEARIEVLEEKEKADPEFTSKEYLSHILRDVEELRQRVEELDVRIKDLEEVRTDVIQAVSYRDIHEVCEPNLLDDIFGDPVKQLENLWKKAGEVK